jgi:hypothetical protein
MLSAAQHLASKQAHSLVMLSEAKHLALKEGWTTLAPAEIPRYTRNDKMKKKE